MVQETLLGFPAHTLPYRCGSLLLNRESRPALPDGFHLFKIHSPFASPMWHSRHFKPEYRYCCRSLAAIERMAVSSPTMTSSSLARVSAVYSTPRTMRLGAEGMAASTTQRYSLP